MVISSNCAISALTE